MKILRFVIILIATLTVLLTACGRSGSVQDASDVNSFGLGETDSSGAADTIPTPQPEPEITFAAADDAVQYMNESEDSLLYSQGIIPMIAGKSLKYAQKLLNNKHPRFLIVDKATMNVIVYDKYGREQLRYGMACAKNYGTKHKKADSRTPEGIFEVQGIYDSTDWLYTDDYGKQSKKKGQYGPRFIRIYPQIGIHGTCSPWSIGHRTSHGCIRVTNEHIMQLVELVEKGTPVIVSPGRRDVEVNTREGYFIPALFVKPKKHSTAISEPAEEPQHKTKTETEIQGDTIIEPSSDIEI